MGKSQFVAKHGEESYRLLVETKKGIRFAQAAVEVENEIDIILMLLGFQGKGILEASHAVATFVPADNAEEACRRAQILGYPVEIRPDYPKTAIEVVIGAQNADNIKEHFKTIQALSSTRRVLVSSPKETSPAA